MINMTRTFYKPMFKKIRVNMVSKVRIAFFAHFIYMIIPTYCIRNNMFVRQLYSVTMADYTMSFFHRFLFKFEVDA